MSEKDIIARIERLEKLALLAHGTLDVGEIVARLKASSERHKEMQKEHEDFQKKMDIIRAEREKEMDTMIAEWEEEMKRRADKKVKTK